MLKQLIQDSGGDHYVQVACRLAAEAENCDQRCSMQDQDGNSMVRKLEDDVGGHSDTEGLGKVGHCSANEFDV
jgi:hypothetical protein